MNTAKARAARKKALEIVRLRAVSIDYLYGRVSLADYLHETRRFGIVEWSKRLLVPAVRRDEKDRARA